MDARAAAVTTAAPTASDTTTPSGGRVAAGLAADVTPVVGELKGFAEIFTGKDLVTGEELGWWRFAGILELVGLNEVKHLRHADEVVDAARKLGSNGISAKISLTNVADEIDPYIARNVGKLLADNDVA